MTAVGRARPRLVPLRRPWSHDRIACRPLIGDALLSEHPEVAKTLAEGSRSDPPPRPRTAIDRIAGSAAAPAAEAGEQK